MPHVSVIVPCYNEERTITLLLDAVHAQTHPRDDMEVVIADGFSTDGTRRQIQRFQDAHQDLSVRVVDNPAQTIPAGLNRAIQVSNGEFIIRLDAHSVPEADYVATCVADLEAGRGENVGGVWQIRPGGPGWVAHAIALAAGHPFGVGDARYRYTGKAQEVDTVPFGAFKRKVLLRLGGFNERLLTNEDYELNVRIRRSGGKIWLNPAIRCQYFARPDLASLARQYARYGYWKARMLLRYPTTVRLRQVLPPLFVLSLLVAAALAFWLPAARWVLAGEVVLYGLAALAAAIPLAAAHQDVRLLIGVPVAMGTMHASWGGAFLWSLLTAVVRRTQV